MVWPTRLGGASAAKMGALSEDPGWEAGVVSGWVAAGAGGVAWAAVAAGVAGTGLSLMICGGGALLDSGMGGLAAGEVVGTALLTGPVGVGGGEAGGGKGGGFALAEDGPFGAEAGA